MSLEILESQIRAALAGNLYFLALQSALTVPDICGAMGSDDGLASKVKYVDWYDEWARPQFSKGITRLLKSRGVLPPENLENPVTGEVCYNYRCAMLHQARATHPKLPYSRLIFIEPGGATGVIHYSFMEDALVYDLQMFCCEILEGLREWMDFCSTDERFISNKEHAIKRFPNGVTRYVSGVPIIM